MDINKDDIFAGEGVSEDTTPAEELADTLKEESITEESVSTLDVTQDDIDDEMSRYGALECEEEASTDEVENTAPVKKKGIVQMPIIIATIAILVTAIIVSGVILVYDAFFKPGISGTYVLADNPESGTYFIFDKDGNISMDGGGIRYFGTYTIEKVDDADVITSEFYFMAYNGGQATVTYSDNKQMMSLEFPTGTLNFIKTKLPKFKVEPEKIIHASADELDITELNIDDRIVGTWSEEQYGTYTFNADGTGSCLSEYTYNPFNGYGLGIEYNFKYTVHDGKILVTIDYYDGSNEDGVFTYYFDKGNFILNGMKYTKVEK